MKTFFHALLLLLACAVVCEAYTEQQAEDRGYEAAQEWQGAMCYRDEVQHNIDQLVANDPEHEMLASMEEFVVNANAAIAEGEALDQQAAGAWNSSPRDQDAVDNAYYFWSQAISHYTSVGAGWESLEEEWEEYNDSQDEEEEP